MAGGSDLREMLRGMEPVLAGEPYGFSVQGEVGEMAGIFALVAEEEGLTVIAPLSRRPAGDPWARIGLRRHGDLAAAGRAVAARGGRADRDGGAGFRRDHILGPRAGRAAAGAALRAGVRDA